MIKSRKLKLGACSPHRGEKNCLKILERRPERNRSLGRLTHKLEYNMKPNLKEIGVKFLE
jgi:hypothetical protein